MRTTYLKYLFFFEIFLEGKFSNVSVNTGKKSISSVIMNYRICLRVLSKGFINELKVLISPKEYKIIKTSLKGYILNSWNLNLWNVCDL